MLDLRASVDLSYAQILDRPWIVGGHFGSIMLP